ncbi:vWA domain-containing protein [Arhodomonas sp. SL1]|uniref:vWA domain-containing protein n=1 Tax=Arhodomonas sp. SL1 TaxID=3425691 RepID=UPI003F884023
MGRFVGFLVLLLALVMTAAPVSGQSAGTGKTVLVLDASGSMWGQIEGEAKITIAREVINGLLDDLPEGQELGLTVYGHREKGNCADIETMVEPGPDTRGAIRSAIAGINPKGKTPLSAAVRAAAESLKYEEEKATVILVSDGRETCDLDPCEVGRDLESLGVDFTAHVVGFDVAEPEARAQLQCLAENTGGRFLTAATAGELSRALEEVSAPAAPETVDAVFEATEGDDGPVITRDLVWTLTRLDTEDVILEGFDVATLTMAVEPGEYRVEVLRSSDEATASREVVVTAEPRQRFELPLEVDRPEASVSAPESAAAGDTVVVQWAGPDEERDYIAVAPAGSDSGEHVNYTYTKEGSPLKLVMPPEPGDYEIRYIQRQGREILASQAVAVTAVEASLTAPSTAEAGATVPVQWQGPDYRRDYIAVAPAGSDSGEHVNYTYTKEGSPLKLVMPPEPGDYEIRYIQRQGREILASQAVAVTAVEASLTAPSTAEAGATVPVQWQGPDYQRDYIAVAPAGSDSGEHVNYTYTKEGSPLKLVMPPEPGDYEIRYIQRQGREILASQAVAVIAVEASLTAPSTAEAGATVPVQWQGPDYRRDYIAVAPAGSDSGEHVNYTYTKEGSPLKLVMPPEPGDYEIRYIQRQGREILASQAVAVTAVEALLMVPSSAEAGQSIPVQWEGPDYRRDYIGVFPVDGGPRDHISYTYTKEGSPLALDLPEEPGDYEIRYIMRQGRLVLATTPLSVE